MRYFSKAMLVASAALCLNLSAYSQDISLKINNVTVKEAMERVKKDTGYSFVFSSKDVNTSKRISVSVSDASIEEVIKQILKGQQGLDYEIQGKKIVLRKAQPVSANGNQEKKTVSGKVVDANGEPVIGATIMEKGTTNGTITDFDGNFNLNVIDGAQLEVSYIGFKSQNVKAVHGKSIAVTLNEDTEVLEEVVVVGYGTMKKKDLTGAISTLRTEKLTVESPVSLQDMMRANLPGLNVGLSTDAKGNPDITIRGRNTLKAGSSPLIVLDGVIYEGSIADINPMDVESMDVLKDASSAAVYGAKSANGVIVINTKKGKSGKPVINFNANVGVVQVADPRDIMNGSQFLAWRQDFEEGKKTDEYLQQYPGIYDDPRKLAAMGINPIDWYNYDRANPVTTMPSEQELLRQWAIRLELREPEIENFLKGYETEWDKLVFQNGLQQDYTASISNKTDNFSYYWSMGYADREGITTNENYKTFRTRLNIESKITDFLTVGLNANFSTRDESDMALTEWGQMTFISPYGSNNLDDPNSLYKLHPTGEVDVVNPFYNSLYRDKLVVYNTLNANIYAKINFPFGIKYQMNFIPYYGWGVNYVHESSEHEEWKAKGGSASRSTSKTFNWQIDHVLSWEKDFKNFHKLNLTFLVNAEKGQYWSQVASTSNFNPSDFLGYHALHAGSVPYVSSNDTYKTGNALMGRIFYSYKNRYMLTTTIRRDGYSAFGKRNPYATFPSVALGWTFTQEKFMEPVSSWLSYGKLRLSWGQNGNRDIGQYEALSILKSGPHPYIDKNGNLYVTNMLYVDKMSNYDLKWERTSAYNIGLDYSLFNDRINGSLETYFTKTNDLLINRKLPQLIGFNSVTSNLGEIQNKGFEMSVNASIINNNNFSWNLGGNFSLNRRKITHLYGDMVNVYDDNGNIVGQKEADDVDNKWFIGHDPDEIWDYERDGVWQIGEEEEAAVYGCQPGDFKYVDQNSDGVMNNEDRVFQGYTTPRFRWTLRNEFVFMKNMSLSFMLYSYWGQKGTFDRAANNYKHPDRTSDYLQPYWTPDNPINDFARIGSKNIGHNYISRSFIRLDNITLSYNVPSKIIKPLKVQNMRFSFSVRNVCDFAPEWKYWDPETGNPTPRTFNLGINFTL